MPCSSRDRSHGHPAGDRSVVGPAVVLVHGVGVGPESFVETARLLSVSGRQVHRVVRGGYETSPSNTPGNDRPAISNLEAQVDRILEDIMKREEQPSVWVGVSGGATLGVIAACRRPAVIAGALLHEPLIGTRAAALHDGVQAAAARLAGGQLDSAAVESSAADFVAGLVGPESWEALGVDGRTAVLERARLVGAEVPYFASFEAPTAFDDAVPVLITVGERSPAPRHEAAERAAELLKGRLVVIPGIGHLPQVEAPETFAELIRSF
jgi:pimeloyl-ACP methyl ester carboxylesterase